MENKLIEVEIDSLYTLIKKAIHEVLEDKEQKKTHKDLLNFKERCEYLGIHLSTLNKWKAQNKIPFRRGHFFLIRMNDGGFLAMSLKCSHLGCSIIWDEKVNEFICPCHSSKFSISGDVINPPAPRALDVYERQFTEGKLFINLNKKNKRDEFEKSQLTYT